MTASEQPSSEQPGDATETSPPKKRGWLRCLLKIVGVLLLALVLLGITGWACAAIYYSDLSGGGSPRSVMAGIYAIAALVAVFFIRPRRYGVLACIGLFIAVVIWFFSLKPSNTRDWQTDVDRIPTIDVNGDQITVHNVRNFDYRSETDYTPVWEDRTYDVSKLRRLDYMLVYWGSPAIAHAMVSFDFEGDQYLAVSIEARKQKSESYSAIQGFFRQYELIYIFSDERDVVKLRTDFRHEDVYLYRTNASPTEAKQMLMSYIASANTLARQPEFYNALTTNCATSVLKNVQEFNPSARLTWRILASGYAAEQSYFNGRLDTSMPYEELKAKSHINEKAIKIGNDPNFSKLIRVDLPTPAQRK